MGLDVRHDECREQQAGQDVRYRPVVPHLMIVSVPGDVQTLCLWLPKK